MKKRRYHLSPKGLQAKRDCIRLHRPWTKSTGPKSSTGKRMSSLNAYKTGNRSRLFGAW